MKLNFYRFTFVLFLTCILSTSLQAQIPTQKPKVNRCATMEAFEHELKTDPAFKADWEAKNRDLDAYLATHTQPKTESLNPANPLIIPVVVHIVLPNPNIVTDDDVEYFINALNRDYSGLNADSGNYGSYLSRRGHAAFRFALARRDVNGKSTNGIERKVSTTAKILKQNPQPVKVVSSGGLAPWDVTKYYNLFVGEVDPSTAADLLGISPYIGPGKQTGNGIDGVCVNYQVFSHNTCFSNASYNLSRTAVHEIGHNLGLFHPFQGNNCAFADFTTQLSSPGAALPASMLASSNDDTPPTNSETYGDPTPGTQSGCNVELMYQNYMDYCNDASMTMFTNNQVKRMEYVIENLRSGWLTTKGHLPPDGTPINEVGLSSIVSPGGSEQIGCKTYNYATPTCGNILPKLNVTNYGVADLTSVTIGVTVNGVAGISQTFLVNNLKPGKSMVLTLPSQKLNQGANIIKYFTLNPNGITDSVPSNDTLTQSINVTTTPVAPSVLPIFEGFEGTAFNPTANNWSVYNPDSATITWGRVTNAFKTGSASARMNMFSYTNSVGHIDYLYSPQLFFNNIVDSVFITFDYAYKLRQNSANYRNDSLMVLISDACSAESATWTQLWKKGGDDLRTAITTSASNWAPTAADWTTSATQVKVNLDNYKSGPVFIALATKNGGGQNLFVDNINIYSTPSLPLKLVSFNAIQTNNNIVCKWETKLEEGVNNYEVERSIDGRTFSKIGTVKAIGNSVNNYFYQFVDEQGLALNKNTIYYRLKMNDDNGKFTYSNIVMIKIGEKQLVQIYPNPAKNNLNVQITSTTNNTVNGSIQVVDYLGRVIIDKSVIIKNGSQSFEINTSNLASANYMVVIKNADEVKILKFSKQ